MKTAQSNHICKYLCIHYVYIYELKQMHLCSLKFIVFFFLYVVPSQLFKTKDARRKIATELGISYASQETEPYP